MTTARKRPWSVTAVAVLYIGVGAAALAYDLYCVATARRWPSDLVLAGLTEAAGLLSGAFLLRGARWAQWLALAWIAFHVVISLNSIQRTAAHGMFLLVIAWALLHPEARAYFKAKPQPQIPSAV